MIAHNGSSRRDETGKSKRSDDLRNYCCPPSSTTFQMTGQHHTHTYSLPLPVFGPLFLGFLSPPRPFVMMPNLLSEAIVVGVGVAVPTPDLFWDQVSLKLNTSVPTIPSKARDGLGNPRDPVTKMISGVSAGGKKIQ